MPLEKDDAIVLIKTLLALMKVQPEPDLQTIMQTYSMCKAQLEEHNKSAQRVIENRNRP
jgi:hypothetical protein